MDDQPSPTFIEDAKSVGKKGRGGGRGRSPGKQRATPTPGTRRSSRLHHDDVTTPDELMSDDDKHLVTTFFVASVALRNSSISWQKVLTLLFIQQYNYFKLWVLTYK